MALFKVKAGTLEGKVFYREMEAASREEIASRLEKEGLLPIGITRKGFGGAALFGEKAPVKPGELIVFSTGLATLLRAGVSVIESLDILMKSAKNRRLSDALDGMIRDVKSGLALSEAMRKNPAIFPGLYAASIGAAERTGDLIPAIKGQIEFMKRLEAMRKKMVSAATYPVVLAVASLIVITVLVIYVLPSFAKIYVDTGVDLPLPTKALLSAVGTIKGNIFIFVIAAMLAVTALRFLFGGKHGVEYLDGLKLRFGRFGEIYRGYATAKFSRTLGMVLKSGMPLIEGLEMSRSVLDNVVLETKMGRVITKVKQGSAVTDAIAGEDIMPEMALRMLGVGERSASLPAILEEIADFHEQDVNHKIGILTDLIEPALMIIMGLVIGTIVVLMYLPIFKMGGAF